jgi:hypothetical protein
LLLCLLAACSGVFTHCWARSNMHRKRRMRGSYWLCKLSHAAGGRAGALGNAAGVWVLG